MLTYWLIVYGLVALIGTAVLIYGAVKSYKDYVKEGFGIVESTDS